MAETLLYNSEFNVFEFNKQELQQVARKCGLDYY